MGVGGGERKSEEKRSTELSLRSAKLSNPIYPSVTAKKKEQKKLLRQKKIWVAAALSTTIRLSYRRREGRPLDETNKLGRNNCSMLAKSIVHRVVSRPLH